MELSGLRPIGFALLLSCFGRADCNRPKQAASESSTRRHPSGSRNTQYKAPDAFYDPPSAGRTKPGTLLRSELLKDLVLPVGVRGWPHSLCTTVADNTPATAVAKCSRRPIPSEHAVVAWAARHEGPAAEMYASAPVRGEQGASPERNRIRDGGWVCRDRCTP